MIGARLILVIFIAGWTSILIIEIRGQRRTGWIVFDIVAVIIAVWLTLEMMLIDLRSSKSSHDPPKH